VASSVSHPAIQKHCEAGGKAIAVGASTDTPMIVLLTAAGKITPLMAVNDIPASMGGAAQYNVMNAMFAIAITLGLGIEQADIIASLSAFKMSVENTPGRLNEVAGLPFRVIVDVAHNAHGFRALVGLINQLPVQGKKIVNFGASGRLSDEHIQEYARIAAGNFDLYVLKNHQMNIHQILKHRPIEEGPEMIKKELIHLGVSKEKIIVKLDVMDSLETSLKNVHKGDLLIVLVKVDDDDKFKVIKKLEAVARELSMDG
jgi:cyanophycin synthetase